MAEEAEPSLFALMTVDVRGFLDAVAFIKPFCELFRWCGGTEWKFEFVIGVSDPWDVLIASAMSVAWKPERGGGRRQGGGGRGRRERDAKRGGVVTELYSRNHLADTSGSFA